MYIYICIYICIYIYVYIYNMSFTGSIYIYTVLNLRHSCCWQLPSWWFLIGLTSKPHAPITTFSYLFHQPSQFWNPKSFTYFCHWDITVECDQMCLFNYFLGEDGVVRQVHWAISFNSGMAFENSIFIKVNIQSLSSNLGY